MTEKYYYTNPNLTSWTTRMKEIIEKDDYCLITLEQTAFYPEGGGQPCDLGTINNIQVVDVFEENGEVYHKVRQCPPDEELTCIIDWQRRFDHMQHHSGQHLLSAVCIELFDAHTVSFHLGSEDVTIDLSTSILSDDQLKKIELRANESICENKEIKTYFIDNEQVQSLPLRKIPDVTEEIRIVEIDDIDTSACCGTHVTRTGEIGMIKLLKTEKHRGNVRLSFKCGFRVLADYRHSHNTLTAITNTFSTNRDGVIDKIDKMTNENKFLQNQLKLIKDENHMFIALNLLKDNTDHVIVHSFQEKSLKDLQSIARQLFTKSKRMLIFVSQLENRLLFTHDGSSSINCGQLLKEKLSEFNGKGGGNGIQAQASFSNKGDMDQFVQFLYDYVTREN